MKLSLSFLEKDEGRSGEGSLSGWEEGERPSRDGIEIGPSFQK